MITIHKFRFSRSRVISEKDLILNKDKNSWLPIIFSTNNRAKWSRKIKSEVILNMIQIGTFIEDIMWPALLTDGISTADTKDNIVNLFNSFLTNISSISSVSKQECSSFINSRFDEMVENKFFEPSRSSFEFSPFSHSIQFEDFSLC
jgi:hypothetical protein